jgi:hypothetical protein
MASSRLELQTLLKDITENVYFQPPNSIQIQYPCIMYERSGSELDHANNRLYRHTKRYQVTVIDRNPDSELSDRVIALPLCSFDRYFVADDLNHYVYTLFF